MSSPSVDPNEIAKFSAMADEWWDEEGKFKPLHRFNPIRVEYIRDVITNHFGKNPQAFPLKGLDILDIGCGGGLLSEPMARMGGNVTAIDASETNIQIASLHSQKEGLEINYQATTAENIAHDKKQFDVVLNMEVIEHVADVKSFMESCCALVKPGGLLFVATLNRTAKSYLLAIIGAEYILRWLPRGTHQWKKFLKPSEIEATLTHGVSLETLQGVRYLPLQDRWKLSDNLDVNYMLVASKA